MTPLHTKTLKVVEAFLHLPKDEALLKICEELDQRFQHFNWTGFYNMNFELSQLELGPYVGEKTSHTIIPFGRGICGQVAVSGETFISQNVKEEENYLACSSATQAEIVVPIFNLGNQLVGQLDIDSHYAKSITREDEKMLFDICEKIRPLFS